MLFGRIDAQAHVLQKSSRGANGELPNIADFADNFKIDVDQETNTANFTFDSKGGHYSGLGNRWCLFF